MMNEPKEQPSGGRGPRFKSGHSEELDLFAPTPAVTHTIRLRSGGLGWHMSDAPESIAIAKQIGLPLLSYDGKTVAVFLPNNLMDGYRTTAAAHGVDLIIEDSHDGK